MAVGPGWLSRGLERKKCFNMHTIRFINIKYVIVSISGLLNNMLREFVIDLQTNIQ